MIHATSDAHRALTDYLNEGPASARADTLAAVRRRVAAIDRDPALGAPLRRSADGHQRRALNVGGTRLQMHYTVADNGDLLIYNFTREAQIREHSFKTSMLERQRERTRDVLLTHTDEQLRAHLRTLTIERDDVHRQLLSTSPTSPDFEDLTEKARSIDTQIDSAALQMRARIVDAAERDPTGHLARCTEHLADRPHERTTVMRGLEQRHRLLDIDHADMTPATADRVLKTQRERMQALEQRRLERGKGPALEVGF